MPFSNTLRPILLAAIFTTAFLGAEAQFDTSFVKTSIRSCSDSLAYGFKTRNWELFARYSNPAMIGTMGGKDEFINYLSQTFALVPDSAWKVYEPGKVLQIVKTGSDFQSIIELRSVIEWQGRRITNTSHLIGQSWDGGSFWTFFDSQNDAKAAKQIKPDISSELIIPGKMEKVEPILPPFPLKPATAPATGNKKATGKPKSN